MSVWATYVRSRKYVRTVRKKKGDRSWCVREYAQTYYKIHLFHRGDLFACSFVVAPRDLVVFLRPAKKKWLDYWSAIRGESVVCRGGWSVK